MSTLRGCSVYKTVWYEHIDMLQRLNGLLILSTDKAKYFSKFLPSVVLCMSVSFVCVCIVCVCLYRLCLYRLCVCVSFVCVCIVCVCLYRLCVSVSFALYYETNFGRLLSSEG